MAVTPVLFGIQICESTLAKWTGPVSVAQHSPRAPNSSNHFALNLNKTNTRNSLNIWAHKCNTMDDVPLPEKHGKPFTKYSWNHIGNKLSYVKSNSVLRQRRLRSACSCQQGYGNPWYREQQPTTKTQVATYWRANHSAVSKGWVLRTAGLSVTDNTVRPSLASEPGLHSLVVQTSRPCRQSVQAYIQV